MMPGFNLNKQLVLKGIGKGYINTVSDKFLEIMYGQNLKLDVKATLTDVEGGDSLFAIYTYVSKKEGTIEVDSATFSLTQIGILQGAKYKSIGVKKNERRIVKRSDLSLGNGFTGVTGVKCISPDGEAVANVVVTDTGEITWPTEAPSGEYVFWFKVDAEKAVEAMMLKDAMPEICEFNWMLETEDLEGNKYQVDIYAKRVRADGGLSLDTSRDKASVPKLTLKILDPGDGSEDFARITITHLGASAIQTASTDNAVVGHSVAG